MKNKDNEKSIIDELLKIGRMVYDHSDDDLTVPKIYNNIDKHKDEKNEQQEKRSKK